MLYFDNAATTEMCEPALSALIETSKYLYGNASTVYGLGRRAKEVLETSRSIIAGSIGADADEIFFTSGGTESNNWVISSAGNAVDRIITTNIEHHAVMYPTEKMKAFGKDVSILSADSMCRIKTTALGDILDDRTALVSVMMQNNETGVIQDIASLVETVKTRNDNSIFHTDAVQVVGHRDINVHKLGVDMLSASAHKFNGPKGVGFLYIRKECSISSFILGGGQEKGLRSGTENVAGIYSMAKALENNTTMIRENSNHIFGLERLFFSELKKAGITYTINGDSDNKGVGIINIAIEGADAEGLLNTLDMHDICISIGSACNSKSKERSHVLTAMGLDEERIDSSVRISMGRYNKEEEVIELVKWIKNYYELTHIARS